MSVTYLHGREQPSDHCGQSNILPANWDHFPELPTNITLEITPGRSPADAPAFNSTCWPSEVHVIQGCFLWCEIPQRYYESGDKSPQHAINNFGGNWTSNRAAMNSTDLRITGSRVAGGGRVEVSTKMLGTWFLVVSAFLMYAT